MEVSQELEISRRVRYWKDRKEDRENNSKSPQRCESGDTKKSHKISVLPNKVQPEGSIVDVGKSERFDSTVEVGEPEPEGSRWREANRRNFGPLLGNTSNAWTFEQCVNGTAADSNAGTTLAGVCILLAGALHRSLLARNGVSPNPKGWLRWNRRHDGKTVCGESAR